MANQNTTNSAETAATEQAAVKKYKATLTQCIKFEGKPYKIGEDITISEDQVETLKPYAKITAIKEE